MYAANKCDKLTFEQCSNLQKSGCLAISAKEKQGVDMLLAAISERIKQRFTANSNLLITRKRYREALQDVVENLRNFNFDKEIELTAEDIRLAARSLGKITGQVEVNEILDRIFGDFCIGK